MKDYRQLIKELPSKTVVFAFGRFNPPTIGHELLVKAVKKLAQQKNADHVIYASRSQDSKKNPLTVDKKVKYLNLMFRNTKFAAANEHVRTFIEAAKELNKRYKNIVMVAGSDRVPEFKRLLNTYNGKEFNFDTIEVISAGERDPDADDASGMSASKMRALAVKGNYSEFKKGLPSTVRDIDGKRLMNDIREGMGLESIKEQIVLVKDDLREKYFRGEIFNEGDIVESDGEKFTIVKRGSNHLLLKEQTGALVSKWIHDVQPTEEKDMNEALTDKTLKPNDKLKVARIIATMLGVENAETSSNPDMLINQALRRVRTKSLNPEALAILDKMLNLATEQGIQYDATLKPTKLKEAVTQPNGTDKISVTTDSPVVNKKSKYNFAKDILRFNDFKKLQKVQEHEEPNNDDKKDNESDHDYEHEINVIDPSEVGHTLVGVNKQDNLRRRKVKYHLGEQHKIPHIDMSAYEDEAGHENTAQHIVTNPEHTKKQKKLAQSFISKMQSSVAESVNKEQIDEVSSDLVKKARDVAFAKGKDDQGHRFVKKAYEKGQKESDAMAKKMAEEIKEPTGDLKDACWKGYTAVGMKMKNGKKVPNCVPVKEENAIDIEDYEEKWEEHIFADEEPSEEELDHFMNHISDDDIYDLYDEDELTVVDDETGEELPEDVEEKELEEETLMEVLSRIERMKAKFRIRRTKAKRERATKIALKRYSNTKTINKRSRRLAVKLMKKRLLRGRDPSKISVAEKERVEKVIQNRKQIINRLAMRLAPRVRKIEKSRLSHTKMTKGSGNVAF